MLVGYCCNMNLYSTIRARSLLACVVRLSTSQYLYTSIGLCNNKMCQMNIYCMLCNVVLMIISKLQFNIERMDADRYPSVSRRSMLIAENGKI